MADGTLKVGTITTSSGSGTITLGQSGETISVPSGVTMSGMGKVLQVATVNWGGDVNTSSGSYVQADSNFEVSLTPSSTSNKILIHMNGGNAYLNSDREMKVQMYRKIGAGSYSGITTTDVDSNTTVAGYVMRAISGANQMQIPHSFSFLDSPNTTSTVYYSPYFNSQTANPVYFNTTDVDNWNINLTIMEIAG